MKLHKAAHTVNKTQYYIVWVTRFRRKILVKGITEYLTLKLPEARKFYPDGDLTEIGIEKDHVHLQYGHSTKVPCQFCGGDAEETYQPEAEGSVQVSRQVYWEQGGIWSTGYFVSMVGIDEKIIRR